MPPPFFFFFYLKIGLDIGRVFAKCLVFDEFFFWFTHRLSKSTYEPLMHPNLNGKKYIG